MKYKGLPIIVDALKLLHEKGQDFRMVFIGSGGDAEELEATVEAYGLRQKVFFTGPIRDRSVLRAWNTRASLFLFPSTYDTNGIVVREAAACGLASVLIDGSCASEGVTHGRNGYLIEENAASMAALLEQVSVNPSGMRQTGQHAMDEIYVSWNQSVRIAYDRYAEIIEEKKAGTLLNRKKQPADFALALSAEMMDGAQQIFQLPRNLHEGMMENIAELRDEIHGVREDFLRIRNNVRDNVVENLQKHLGE